MDENRNLALLTFIATFGVNSRSRSNTLPPKQYSVIRHVPQEFGAVTYPHKSKMWGCRNRNLRPVEMCPLIRKKNKCNPQTTQNDPQI